MLSGRPGPPEPSPAGRSSPAPQRDGALRVGVRRAGRGACPGRTRVARSRRPVRVASVGMPIAIGGAAVLIAYVVFKYVRRRRFLRHLRQARITPVELKRRLDAGDHVVVIDLRTALDMEAAPYGIPGACRITPEALQHPHQLIPRDREVVFYCAEPKEATSARMALRLASNGFKSIHPLSGGLEGWREAGFVVVPLAHCSVTPA